MSGLSPIPPGYEPPWRWYGQPDGLYLATQHGGRRIVMDFAQAGGLKGGPRFPINGVMVPARELVKFEVGPREVTGIHEAKANKAVYRRDVRAIDHPFARLMEASPILLASLARLVKGIEEMVPAFGGALDAEMREARAAIAIAEGVVTT